MRPCMHAQQPTPFPGCAVCKLYFTDDAYRALWGGPSLPTPVPPRPPRSLPCLFLGEVLDKLNCPCPGKWVRRCSIHSVCTLETCKTCNDYDSEG